MEEKKIIIDNLKVNYKTAGQGPAVLVLHGWGGSSDSWLKFQEILSQKNFKVVCPDLPGFGKSLNPPIPWSIDDYVNFIYKFGESIGLKEFFLIGHSFGGGLAVKFSVKYPKMVKSLILSDAAVIRKKRYSFRQMIAYLIAKVGKFLANAPFIKNSIYPFFKKMVYKISGTKDYYLAKGTMKETIKKVFAEDLSDYLSKIKIPTLIVWGKKDKSVPLQYAYILKEHITNSKLEVLPEIGHSPNLENPKELSEIIINFFRNY